MTSCLLQRATVVHVDETGRASHRSVDVRVADGRIAEVADANTIASTADDRVDDLNGWVLLAAAVEPHAHLDKAFLAERVENPTGDLMGAIEAMRSSRHLLGVEETIERAERAARLMAANGFAAVRTHADTTVEHGLRSIEALVEVKRRVADVIDVEIVSLCGWPCVGPAHADQRALLRDAMQVGADLVGGVPHLEDDPRAATELLLQTAVDHGAGVDLHTDETLDASILGLADLLDAVEAGFELPVTASHCVSLGVQPEATQREIAERVAAAGVSVVALPHTNLFLQGRGHTPMPRALTAVGALRAAGANVAFGADNLQDPFNPVGRACPFETAGLAIATSHLLPHEAWSAVSAAGTRALGRNMIVIEPESQADLVAVPATTLREAIAFGPTDRKVWRRGNRIDRQ
ncbi:MAG: amidohydrolase family protein [Actinomycetota bacterium]